MRLLLAAAVILLAACTAIDIHRPPPKDWPKLQTTVIRLGFWDTQQKCGGNLIMQTLACAEFRFDTMTCTIWTSTDDPYVMEHELAHCEGYEHYWSTFQRDLWEQWKKQQGGL